jgi:hypothetical protein
MRNLRRLVAIPHLVAGWPSAKLANDWEPEA